LAGRDDDHRTVEILLRRGVLPGHEDTWARVQVSILDTSDRKRNEREPIDIHLEWSVLPGHEAAWDRVLVSIADIAARKRVEAYVQYLGTHDSLTGLYNRAFYDATMHTLMTNDASICSVVVADLNGLKRADNQHGHADGDTLIKRIRKVIEVNNQFYQGPRLSIALGAATAATGPELPAAHKLADQRMYADKCDRRRPVEAPPSPEPALCWVGRYRVVRRRRSRRRCGAAT